MKFLIIASLLFSTTCCLGAEKVQHLSVTGVIDEELAKAFVETLEDSDAKQIIIEFNTVGGEVDEGFKMAKAIETSTIPIVCVVDGEAASMGFYLLQSCPVRVMTKRSRLMAHQPSVGGVMPSVQFDKWENITNMVQALADAMSEWCGRRIKGGPAEYRRQTANGRDWWMGWSEALKVRAVDKVVDTPAEVTAWYAHRR